MIKTFILQWFNGVRLADTNEYSLYCRPPVTRNTFFAGKTAEARALVVLKQDTVNIEEMLSLVTDYIRSSGDSPRTSRISWLFLSDRGGVYLYEALADKGNFSAPGVKSRLFVVNSGDGSFSFGPGHEKNSSFSSRMRDLLLQARTLPPSVLYHELSLVFEQGFSLVQTCKPVK